MTTEWIADVPQEMNRVLASDFQMGPIFDEQGRRLLAEETVTNLNGLKIQIFSDEHPPPHFRVSYAGETANFSIRDCEKLNGGLEKWERNIRAWHSTHKDDLIAVWNRTRPSDCPVGAYRS